MTKLDTHIKPERTGKQIKYELSQIVCVLTFNLIISFTLGGLEQLCLDVS